MTEYTMTIEQVVSNYWEEEDGSINDYQEIVKTLKSNIPCHLFNDMLEMKYWDKELNKTIHIQEDLYWIDDNVSVDGWLFTFYDNGFKASVYWFDAYSKKLEILEG